MLPVATGHAASTSMCRNANAMYLHHEPLDPIHVLPQHQVMYSHWGINALVVTVTAISVALAVVVHYEGLRWLSIRLMRPAARRRRKVLIGVYGVIALHVMEIWLFGAAMWFLLGIPDAGQIKGVDSVHFLDAIYLSAVTFSTVGFGDITPVGPLRFICGTEALAGFILITWSASFLYLEMEQFWRQRT